ncbi:MAG: helix-turn-helix domain-containing protein [Phycisphaeraceae bacterium]|nr:helix-turn-helix domain-containing protein [Phycisphaeraceae bacterium]
MTEPITIEPVPRMALRIVEAAESLGISPRTMADLIAARVVPTVRIGRVVLIPVDQLRAWLSERAQQRAGDGEGGRP